MERMSERCWEEGCRETMLVVRVRHVCAYNWLLLAILVWDGAVKRQRARLFRVRGPLLSHLEEITGEYL